MWVPYRPTARKYLWTYSKKILSLLCLTSKTTEKKLFCLESPHPYLNHNNIGRFPDNLQETKEKLTWIS